MTTSDTPASHPFSEAARDAVYQAIFSRRDVRSQFLPKAIPDEVLGRLLMAAHHAPSVGFMQPWNFLLIRSTETKARVQKLFRKANDEARDQFPEGRKDLYSRLKLEGITDAPINLCITCDRERTGQTVLGRTHIKEMDLYSTVCAVQNLWLAARTEGIGVGWVSIFHQHELKEALGIPENIVPIAYLCLGYVSEFLDRPELEKAGWLSRLPLEDLVFHDTWGQTGDAHDSLAQTYQALDNSTVMLEHGGRLRAAADKFGVPLEQWIDLSTGISPWLYPIPDIPNAAWHRLPEPDDALSTIAAGYYGNTKLLATAGSQPAIQALPSLFKRSQVAIIGPTYNEHIAAWRSTHDVEIVDTLSVALATGASIILLCNPNNPTATHYKPAEILEAAAQLQTRDGWLLVDEAYGDAYPEFSVTTFAGSAQAPRLITLRSLGKFFGLAGARVGFVFADTLLLERLSDTLGPWTISGPSRWIAQDALANTTWQANQMTHIKDAGVRLKLLLKQLLTPGTPVNSTGLFSTFQITEAYDLYEHLAQRGILVRLFREASLIRIGIAADHEWKRLELALEDRHTTHSLKNT